MDSKGQNESAWGALHGSENHGSRLCNSGLARVRPPDQHEGVALLAAFVEGLVDPVPEDGRINLLVVEDRLVEHTALPLAIRAHLRQVLPVGSGCEEEVQTARRQPLKSTVCLQQIKFASARGSGQIWPG